MSRNSIVVIFFALVLTLAQLAAAQDVMNYFDMMHAEMKHFPAHRAFQPLRRRTYTPLNIPTPAIELESNLAAFAVASADDLQCDEETSLSATDFDDMACEEVDIASIDLSQFDCFEVEEAATCSSTTGNTTSSDSASVTPSTAATPAGRASSAEKAKMSWSILSYVAAASVLVASSRFIS